MEKSRAHGKMLVGVVGVLGVVAVEIVISDEGFERRMLNASFSVTQNDEFSAHASAVDNSLSTPPSDWN